jgi:hypothetical protein
LTEAPPPHIALPFDRLPLRRITETGAAHAVYGRSTRITARADSDVLDIRFSDTPLVCSFTCNAAPGETRVTAASVERTLALAGSHAQQRAYVDPRDPLVIIEIAAPVATQMACTFASDDALRCIIDRGRLVVTDSHSVAVTIDAPVTWTVTYEASAIVARASAAPHSYPFILYATSAPTPGTATARLPDAQQAGARILADAASMRRRANYGLRFHADDAAAHEAIEWAKQLLPRVAFRDPAARAAQIVLCLACADAVTARALIDEYDDPAVFLTSCVTFFDWTAERAELDRLWPRIETAFDVIMRDAPREGTADACARVVTVAEEIGRRAFLDERADAVRAITAIGSTPGRQPAWTEVEPDSDLMREVTKTLNTAGRILFDMFGIMPDASRGRIRIAPRIPDDWHDVALEGIAVGDASVSLRYRRHREGDSIAHHFLATQDSGGVPLRLIFEPLIGAGASPVAATVDGKPAQLDQRLDGDRIRVPVQLVLDEERALELRVQS